MTLHCFPAVLGVDFVLIVAAQSGSFYRTLWVGMLDLHMLAFALFPSGVGFGSSGSSKVEPIGQPLRDASLLAL